MDILPDQKELNLDVFIGNLIVCLKSSYQFCCKQMTLLATRMCELSKNLKTFEVC